MKRFFTLTFRPFFLITGFVTTLGGLNAFWPQWTAESVEKIRFVQDYIIILQHWGVMLALVGLSMMLAAFSSEWRTPILIFSSCEKVLIVYLVAANRHYSYSQGFWWGAVMDAVVVLYTAFYFATYGVRSTALGSDLVVSREDAITATPSQEAGK
ncbi:MAG: hypothetical protein ACXVPK_13635 [Tumebacillaceae bacterium]